MLPADIWDNMILKTINNNRTPTDRTVKWPIAVNQTELFQHNLLRY